MSTYAVPILPVISNASCIVFPTLKHGFSLTRVRLNIQISYQYRDSHHKNKTVSWPSWLHKGNPDSWKVCLYIEDLYPVQTQRFGSIPSSIIWNSHWHPHFIVISEYTTQTRYILYIYEKYVSCLCNLYFIFLVVILVLYILFLYCMLISAIYVSCIFV